MELETLLKNTSRSLYLSVQVLPRSMRAAFSVAYLLCRYADTIADTAVIPAERRLFWVKQFPALVREQNTQAARQLTEEINGGSENPYEKILIGKLEDCFRWFNQIEDKQQAFILDVVQAVCEGMEHDLSFFPTEHTASPRALSSQEELEHYCRLMGGKPGLFWSQLIYHTTHIRVPEDTFYQWGQYIGDALQIVNILRDLPKDLQIGRCYFPLSDLQPLGLSPADLTDEKNSAKFETVKRKWIVWGLRRLQNGVSYFAQLPKTQPGQRAAVAWPILWTADTLFAVYQTPDLLNANKRVKISRSTIYFTLCCTPLLWLSNRFFTAWFNYKMHKFNALISQFSDGKK